MGARVYRYQHSFIPYSARFGQEKVGAISEWRKSTALKALVARSTGAAFLLIRCSRCVYWVRVLRCKHSTYVGSVSAVMSIFALK